MEEAPVTQSRWRVTCENCDPPAPRLLLPCPSFQLRGREFFNPSHSFITRLTCPWLWRTAGWIKRVGSGTWHRPFLPQGIPRWYSGKNRLPMQETQETWVRYLGWEDPLEEGMATHYNILTWRIPWTEEPDGLQSTVSQSQTWVSMHTFLPSSQWLRDRSLILKTTQRCEHSCQPLLIFTPFSDVMRQTPRE